MKCHFCTQPLDDLRCENCEVTYEATGDGYCTPIGGPPDDKSSNFSALREAKRQLPPTRRYQFDQEIRRG